MNTYLPQEWNPKIPPRFEKAVYEHVPENIRQLFETMKTTRKGIYIHGKVGTGKTHIAYALYRNAVQKAHAYGRFWNTTELLRDIRLDFDRGAYDKHRTEEELMKYDGILFLDDIGAEKNSDWATETFYMVINKRYNDQLPMVFTSNLSIKDLSAHLDDRTASRIVETCDIIELKGEDRRLQK
jgi:DNA replication protein DnaC